MPTIQGTDGDTTGALITTATTQAELTALIQPATSMDSGALRPVDYDKLQEVSSADMARLATISDADVGRLQAITDNDIIRIHGLTDADILKLHSLPPEAGLSGHIASGDIDLLTIHADVPLAGIVGGRYFIVRTAIWVIESIDGTILTGFEASCGNNGGKNNVLAGGTAVLAADLNDINTAGAPAPLPASALVTDNAQLLNASNQFKVDITVPAIPDLVGGATALTGKLVLEGYWIL